jgi:hypothetical protein
MTAILCVAMNYNLNNISDECCNTVTCSFDSECQAKMAAVEQQSTLRLENSQLE